VERMPIGGSILPSATLLPDGKFAAILESWGQPPTISIIDPIHGKTTSLLSFNHKGYEALSAGPSQPFTWKAPDGLEIQGFLHLPKKISGKIGLITNVHGGPVYANLNTSSAAGFTSLLTSKGYAVFRPNPRGSAGRGQAFATAVVGDMGGADAQDILSGIKAVCDSNPSLFDTSRLGVFGGSYGGYMASLLPTLTPIFAASVSMAAVTDWHSFHTTSNLGTFDTLFLEADPYTLDGGKRYLERSPVMNVGRYKTPVLQTAGTADLAVPMSQAVQYHRAMLEKGVESAIAIYPGEGHGVSKFPAVIDLMVRMLGWFDRFMPA